MRHKISKTGITFLTIIAASLSAYADRLPDNTRLTDDINRTGERFAIVFQNDSDESAYVSLYGDPNFKTVDPGRVGVITVPRKSTGYKVFYRRTLGYPSLVQERAESLENEQGMRISKDVFDGITGMQINSGIFAEVKNRRCETIMPDPKELRNLTQFQNVSAGDLQRMAGIGTNLNLGVAYIRLDANARNCTTTLKVPGDLGFIEDGQTLPTTTANVNDATSVRDNAKKWIDAIVEGQATEGYTPVVTSGVNDGAMAVRDQAAQLLSQRTQVTAPEVGSKIQWATGGDAPADSE